MKRNFVNIILIILTVAAASVSLAKETEPAKSPHQMTMNGEIILSERYNKDIIKI